MLEQVLKDSEGQGCFRAPCAGSCGHGREGEKASFLSGRQPGSQNFPEVLSVNSQTPPSLHPVLRQLLNLKNMLQPAQVQGKSGHIETPGSQSPPSTLASLPSKSLDLFQFKM